MLTITNPPPPKKKKKKKKGGGGDGDGEEEEKKGREGGEHATYDVGSITLVRCLEVCVGSKHRGCG